MKMTTLKHPDRIRTNEEFIPVDNRSVDSRHRVTLSDQVFDALPRKPQKIDSFAILVGTNGNILLMPQVSIPANEAWLFENPKALASVMKGLKDSAEGRVKLYKSKEKA